jgi:hypothetical protein
MTNRQRVRMGAAEIVSTERRLRRAVAEALEPRRLMAADLVISEFLASNDTGIQDSFGTRQDWIEIYNAGDATATLNDYYLTDSAAALTKWRFPVGPTLAPGASVVVFADSRDVTTAGGEMHTNFGLSAGGEYLGLIRASDTQPQFAYAPSFPGQSSDISYGLSNSNDRNSERVFFSVPTPGALNAPSVAKPVLSTGLVFNGSTQVTISTTTPGATIYYTTNNTAPTTASTVYSGPITITQSRIIRAIAVAPSMVNSPIASGSYTAVDGTVSTFRSSLPIVVLDSFNQTFNDQTYVNASATFIDTASGVGGDGYADMLDAVQFTGRIGLRYRGSTSFSNYPKKPFAVEVRDEANGDRNASILGMPSESDWVLYSPWTERSLMNNALAMDWSRQLGRYASRIRFVEVYLNNDADTSINYTDDYQGIYILMEKPKIDEDRVDIEKILPNATAEPDITGGYFFKKDRWESSKTPPEIKIDTTGGAETAWQRFVMVEPDEFEITSPQTTYLTNYLQELDNVMNGASFADPVNGYAKYIDVDSWVDFWIMAEFTKSVDSFWLSTFYYKPRNGKIFMGPNWDFNLAFGQANYRDGASASGWNHDSLSVIASFGDQYGWFGRLFEDPSFVVKVTDRWQELRKTVLSTPKMLADMDAYTALLVDNTTDYPVGPGAPVQASTNAAIRNFKKWPVLGTYSTTNSYFDPQGRWIEDVKLMKSWVAARANWMDTQFAPPPVVAPAGGLVNTPQNVSMTGKASTWSATDSVLLTSGAAAKAIVPSGAISGWQNRTFVDSAWPLSGTMPAGYDTNLADGSYLPVGLNLQSMQNVRSSAYIRIPFNVADPNAIANLVLRMKYDDGFVAWINGVRVIEGNLAENTNPTSSTAALTDRSVAAALQFVEWDVSAAKSALVAGTNVLAIQALNNPIGSTDLLIAPELVSRVYSTANGGTVYYTTDGSDPRGTGGAIGATAIAYAGAINVSSNRHIRARTYYGGTAWSGIADETYTFAQPDLRITEFMYNPAAGGAFTAQDYEWIEVKNVAAAAADLTGLSFTAGVTYSFPSGVSLAPGDYAVIVKNLTAFQERYPSVPAGKILAGVFGGGIDNGGETLTISDSALNVINTVTYADSWYTHTDGGGYSLVARNPAGSEANWSLSSNWRSSEQPQGKPAQDDTDTTTPTLVNVTAQPGTQTLEFQFSEPVTFAVAPGAGLTITDLVTGATITPASVTTNAKVVTVTLPAALTGGLLSAVITAPSITDFAAHALAAAAKHAFAYGAAGQTVVVPQANATYVVNQVALAAGARLDLKNNDLLVDYTGTSPIGSRAGSTYGGVSGLIQSGLNAGAWNGVGLITSMPDATAGLTTLGVGEASEILGLTGAQTQVFQGKTVDATTLIVKYTYAGDANLDGIVSGDDYSAIDFNMLFPGSFAYANGDFNYDGFVTGDDYSAIDFNLLAQGGAL